MVQLNEWLCPKMLATRISIVLTATMIIGIAGCNPDGFRDFYGELSPADSNATGDSNWQETVSSEERARSISNSQPYLHVLASAVAVFHPGGGIGSGVLIDDDRGFLLTNFHVVDGTEEVMICFPPFSMVGQSRTPVSTPRLLRKFVGESSHGIPVVI